MKKWLKIWMLSMAFVAAMTAVVSTGKVEAQSTANNQVQVVIISSWRCFRKKRWRRERS